MCKFSSPEKNIRQNHHCFEWEQQMGATQGRQIYAHEFSFILLPQTKFFRNFCCKHTLPLTSIASAQI